MFIDRRVITKDTVDAPDGMYDAVWSGWVITFSNGEKNYELASADVGIRGTVDIKIEVHNGFVFTVPDKK